MAPKVVDENDDEDRPVTDSITELSASHAEAEADGTTLGITTQTPQTASTTTEDAKKPKPTGEEGATGGLKEELRRAEAEREAMAAAQNLALLPDEPLDRLSGVIGTAMQHGKTVVYSVIRTAARQPNGDLIIPVVGGSMTANGDKQGDGKFAFP